jgi:hypothetical protein
VRTLHASRLRQVTALLPLGAVVEPVRGLFERLRGPRGSADVGELHPMQRAEQLDEAFRQLHAVDPAVVEGASRATTTRLNLRSWVEAALQRLQSSDVALGVHAAASSGGGRVASIAALIGVCVSGVGAGTYCVATALLPDPKPAIRAEAKPPKHVKKRAATHTSKAAPRSSNVRLARAQSTAAPSARAQAPRPKTRRSPSRQQAAQTDEFSFETSATGSGSATARTTSQNGGASSPNGSLESGASSSGAAGGEFSDGTGGEFSP